MTFRSNLRSALRSSLRSALRLCQCCIGVVLLCLAEVSLAGQLIIPAPPQLSATGYLLMDASTGASLVEFNADQRLPPASLTKIMTVYVAAAELAHGSIALDDEVSVSIKAWRTGGSRMFIKEGTRVSLEDILHGIIIQSGNDASVALAEHITGSEDTFVELMQQYAQQLGMQDTHFINATGLPDDEHYSTARDLAKLSIAQINNYPQIYNIYADKQFTYNNIRQPNRNRLLWRDHTVDGIKTGYTSVAGYCLIASAKRGKMRLVSVVMGAGSEKTRLAETRQLLNYGFRYFETVTLYPAQESLQEARVWGGQASSVPLGLEHSLVVTIPKGLRDKMTVEISLQEELHAPLEKGSTLGSLEVIFPDAYRETMTMPMQALEAVPAANFFYRILDAISLYFLKLTDGDPLAAP